MYRRRPQTRLSRIRFIQPKSAKTLCDFEGVGPIKTEYCNIKVESVGIEEEWNAEIEKNCANFYTIKLYVNGELVEGIPNLSTYLTLRDDVYLKTQIELPHEKDLVYTRKEPGKKFAYPSGKHTRYETRILQKTEEGEK